MWAPIQNSLDSRWFVPDPDLRSLMILTQKARAISDGTTPNLPPDSSETREFARGKTGSIDPFHFKVAQKQTEAAWVKGALLPSLVSWTTVATRFPPHRGNTSGLLACPLRWQNPPSFFPKARISAPSSERQGETRLEVPPEKHQPGQKGSLKKDGLVCPGEGT